MEQLEAELIAVNLHPGKHALRSVRDGAGWMVLLAGGGFLYVPDNARELTEPEGPLAPAERELLAKTLGPDPHIPSPPIAFDPSDVLEAPIAFTPAESPSQRRGRPSLMHANWSEGPEAVDNFIAGYALALRELGQAVDTVCPIGMNEVIAPGASATFIARTQMPFVLTHIYMTAGATIELVVVGRNQIGTIGCGDVPSEVWALLRLDAGRRRESVPCVWPGLDVQIRAANRTGTPLVFSACALGRASDA